MFQAFFSQLGLKFRLKRCFEHIQRSSVIGIHTVALILIVHITLGFRRLREMDRYKADPIVLRVLGLRQFPDVATVSRTMAIVDEHSIEEIRALNRQLILEWLGKIGISRITLDVDGSVLSTSRYAREPLLASTKRRKAKGAIIRCSARLPKQARYWIFTIGRRTSMIPAMPRSLSCIAFVPYAKL